MAKSPLSQELFERYKKDRDLLIFKTTKRDFLSALPNHLNDKDLFHSEMWSLEERVKQSDPDSSYIHIRVNNLNQQYAGNHPLWTLTKIHYFTTHKISEYYSPITFCINENSTGLRFHPGIWRMSMLHTQENTLRMTMCIDKNKPCSKELLGYFKKNHNIISARSLSWNDFCKLMNFDKFPGMIYIQDDISGLNFGTDRSKCLEYAGKFDLAYNKNERTFFLNHRPLVRWKNGFYHIL